MWSRRPSSPAGHVRRWAGGLLVVMGLMGLSGCGFQSLYGVRDDGQTTADLARVKVRAISDRTGQILHNHLLDVLNPKGRPAQPRHELAVRLSEQRELLAVRKTAFATRANLEIKAQYSLTRPGRDGTVLQGTETVISSYDIFDSDYATLVAANDARDRAAREIAERIRTKLAVYFYGRRGGS